MVSPCQFTIYACPKGLLTEQLKDYFSKSRRLCGPNTAHRYMPHCSLTNFFRDDPTMAEYYLERLEACYQTTWADGAQHQVKVQKLAFKSNWHGLSLYAPALKQLIRQFAQTSPSARRLDAIRPEPRLCLSLAYDFESDQAKCLESLARKWVDPTAQVHWELRLYRRNAGNKWLCYRQWPL